MTTQVNLKICGDFVYDPNCLGFDFVHSNAKVDTRLGPYNLVVHLVKG